MVKQTCRPWGLASGCMKLCEMHAAQLVWEGGRTPSLRGWPCVQPLMVSRLEGTSLSSLLLGTQLPGNLGPRSKGIVVLSCVGLLGSLSSIGIALLLCGWCIAGHGCSFWWW